jgi:ankyrin repeat protein
MNLFYASRTGDLRTVRKLVLDGTNINRFENRKEGPALLLATKNNHLPVMHFLLQNGANVEQGDRDSISPLLAAIRNNHVDAARLLLQYGANIHRQTKDKLSALDLVVGDDDSMIKLLLENGAKCRRGDDHNLLYASRIGRINMVRRLLEHGVAVDTLNAKKQTALHLACDNGDCAIAELLLNYGANPNLKDKQGLTPLHQACMTVPGHDEQQDYLNLVVLLLSHKVNINEQDKKGWTALHLATNNADLRLTRLLLTHHANVHIKDQQCNTPFSLCFPEKGESIKVADLLLDYGAHNHSPKLDMTMWDWKPAQQWHILRPKYILNWYYYHPRAYFQETILFGVAVAALNDALLQYIPRNATLPALGKASNSSKIIALVVSIIYDMIQNNGTIDFDDSSPSPILENNSKSNWNTTGQQKSMTTTIRQIILGTIIFLSMAT